MRHWVGQRGMVAASLLLFLALSWFWRGVSVSKERDPWQRTSAMFTDATGVRGLHYLLKELGFGGDLWRLRLDRLPQVDGHDGPGTVVLLGPTVPLTPGELRGLLTWVEEGGQVIAFAKNGIRVRGIQTDESETTEEENGRATLFHAFGLEFSRDLSLDYSEHGLWRCKGREVDGEVFSLWTGGGLRFEGNGLQGVVDEVGEVVVAVVPRGKGRMVAALDPYLLSNRSLRLGKNAVWFVQEFCAWGSGRVVIDEYHHGFGAQPSMLALSGRFLSTPWGWCVLQLGVAGLLFLLWTSRRMGRLEEGKRLGARDPLRLVQARAGLFRQAQAQAMAAELICHQVMLEGDGLHRPGQSWEVWWKDQAGRHLGKPVGDSIRRMEGLRLKIREEEPKGESSLVALGQEAAAIQHCCKKDFRYE